jgi:hypothetical protein
MAIDSAEKRRSVSNIGLPWLGPGVTVLAAKDVGWRSQVGYGYSGVADGGGDPGSSDGACDTSYCFYYNHRF